MAAYGECSFSGGARSSINNGINNGVNDRRLGIIIGDDIPSKKKGARKRRSDSSIEAHRDDESF